MTNAVREWTTSAVPQQKAISFWNELLCERVIGLDVQSDTESGFDGRIIGASVSEQHAFMISAGHEQRAYHGLSSEFVRSLRDIYVLIHMRTGSFHLKTKLVDSHLRVGDMVLLSAAEAFQFACPARTSSLVLRFDQPWLRKRVPFADDAIARHIPGNEGWGSTLSSALWNIDPVAVDSWTNPAVEVVEQVAGLLALALQPGDRPDSRASESIATRIRAVVDERFAEHGLTPQAVADTLGISKRSLHQAMSQEATTFSKTVFERRLLEAERRLQNPKNQSLSITEIALNCGFSNPNHFSRVFRQANGMTPTAYRRLR